ncbi:DUF2259 domain-containing protein [Deinococcus sp. KNUC1210]|uniref:DUF2259 domain-containing protein n=1 Tax=Deinococcus sp. KNUC1210 TaxID=2917691 RepID=UPI001EEFF9AE|nr:DUF2259 domain-containing protein [Deinococcus sp. KNUC1210]ULH14898.1 DUF2259 domain-containing protein [Deinococcus sp. KNUC1210]
MRRTPLLIAAALALSGRTLAADFPNIVQQGFSPDGAYHLLLTSYYQDGSGFPRAALQITDVRRNVILYRREQTWRDEAEEEEGSAAALAALVAQWRSGQASVLSRYHLTAPVPGTRLFQLAPLTPQSYPAARASGVATRLGHLTLNSFPLPSGCTFNDFPTLGFALSLGVRDLQHDRRLPASRACASGYRLDTGYQYKNSVAVVLRVYSPGFEGPDAVPLVVTAALK